MRPLTDAEQAEIAGWRYPARYATYNFDDPSVLTRDHWAVISDGTLVGCCCFHDAARAGGVAERPGTLDVAWNQRSLTVATRLGFMAEGSVESDEGKFVLMGRAARPENPCDSRNR